MVNNKASLSKISSLLKVNIEDFDDWDYEYNVSN